VRWSPLHYPYCNFANYRTSKGNKCGNSIPGIVIGKLTTSVMFLCVKIAFPVLYFFNYRTGNGKKCGDSITGIVIGKLTIPVMF
jgi:hypothetical protein